MQAEVIIEEQGLRDGIQNLSQQISTRDKLAIIQELVEAGVRRVQVASFVHPRLVPQMADAEAICEALPEIDEVVFSGLVLNKKGVERGIAAGLKHLACSISASDTHSQKNARKTLKEAKAGFQEMVGLAQAAGVRTRGGIQCAFGCRYEGKIASEHVLDMVQHHLDAGVDELALADSTGMANPQQMEELMAQVLELATSVPVFLHLHNTESKGLANLYAALRVGVRHFDTAFAGLGGCPFIAGATGNIATEDTVHMLHQMGYETGIDIQKMSLISKNMEERLGYALPSRIYQLWGNPEIKII